MVKPLLKWIGGKTQIINTIMDKFPTHINNYHEPFLGGGSVLFAALSNPNIKITGNIYAYDFNEQLINVYKHIQSHPKQLYNKLTRIIDTYAAHPDKEKYYYQMRNEYNTLVINNKHPVLTSALFIFLNKTCFRGMYRVSSNGFNVPYGNYNNPEIINKSHFKAVRKLIKNVIFRSCDFTNINTVEQGDFVYFDPPYAPQTTTSFVSYTKDGFTQEQHETLFNFIHELHDDTIKIMMSNACVKMVTNNFPKNKYNIEEIMCKRSINSKKPNSMAKEVIITNY